MALQAKDTALQAKEMTIKAQDTTLRERKQVIKEQEARLALSDVALKQQMTITRLQEERACKRRKLLLGAVPVPRSDDTEAEEHPAGSTCKGDPCWSRLMNEQARVFCERLARSLTAHAKEARETVLNEAGEGEGNSIDANQEGVAALQDSVVQVLRPKNPAVVARFNRVDGTLIHQEVVRIVCARLPSRKLNSTNLPLAHLFLYLAAKNAWGHAEDLESDLELETALGLEILGDDLFLFTLDEPHGLVPPGTAEYELRAEKLKALREGNAEAQEFFETRGIPHKYIVREPCSVTTRS